MKEVTYGWYPSAHDVYRAKGRPSSYHLECLYKYKDSMYYQGQVAPPQPELVIRGLSPSPAVTPQEAKRHRARTVAVPKFSPVPKLNIPTPTQCWAKATQKSTAETAWGVVGEPTGDTAALPSEVSWPLPNKKQQQQQQQQRQQHQQQQQQQQQQHLLNLDFSPHPQAVKERVRVQHEMYHGQRRQSPQLAWGFRKAQTARELSGARPVQMTGDDLKWPKAQDTRPQQQERPHSSSTVQTPKSPKQSHKSRPSSSPVRASPQAKGQGQKVASPVCPAPPQTCNKTPSSGRPCRIQSATMRRERTPMPTRPMTAVSSRKGSSPPHVEEAVLKESTMTPEKPPDPVPFIYDVNDVFKDEEDDDGEAGLLQSQNTSLEDNYDEIVKKYGWRAEVHGDPYKLKRPLPRMPYAVPCQVPEVPPEPPGIHMETNEPFFLNTIPNKPMVFAVDKEWMSEVLLAKRLELQKRQGGIKYSYKNFSFVY